MVAKGAKAVFKIFAECCIFKLSQISTSNHLFRREIWDKFTEFTFFKFSILSTFQDFNISKNERGNFSPNFPNKHMIPG